MITEALKTGVVSGSGEATEAIGRALARELPEGSVLGLLGDLGVGKTTFVRGFAGGLGHKNISSPSFNYYFLYKGVRPLIHLDAYRLGGPGDYASLMIEELMTEQTTFVVEWPERVMACLPSKIRLLRLSINSDRTHTIRWE